MIRCAKAQGISRLPHRDLSARSSAAARACGVPRWQSLHGGDSGAVGDRRGAPIRQAEAATGVDRGEPGAATGEMEGDRPMSKPPLIRAVKAKGLATLEIAWSTGEKLTVDVSRLIKRFKLY